jgi:tetratricopeptide (TPR) repeat protein
MTTDLQRLTALMSQGNYADLERQAIEVLERRPESGIVWQLLSASLSSQGKDARTALSRAVQYMPGDATAHNNLGNALARAGQFADALECYRRALKLRPHFVEARNNLAQAHDGLGLEWAAKGEWHKAAVCFQQAADIDPGFFETHYNLGDALRCTGEIERSLQSYDRSLQIMPRFAEAHCSRAIALRLLGRSVEAQSACGSALEINPRFAAAFIVLGELSADSGDFIGAERHFRQAISIEPEIPEAWAGIASLRGMTQADADWLLHARQIAERPLPPRKLAVLEFAIGKYLDDLREFEQAFAHFRIANEVQKRCRPPHERQGLAQTVDTIIREHDAQWIADVRSKASDSLRPVFIVGMLRSGTTLAEQILASHPLAFGAGELPFWSNAFAALRAAGGSTPRREVALSRVTEDYLRILDSLSPGALRVVDKMPTNFAFLGMIHALFPRARIIHLHRNPLDTCLSIYFQNFDGAITYANDLGDLAHYFQQYLRLMRHWRALLPADAVLDVPYEELVADQELWSRKMIEFVGLPWDPACLEFHRVRRTVLTASKWQVRQKINSTAVGRWRNYASHLGPLHDLPSAATAARLNCE